MKLCPTCNCEKEETEFFKDKSRRDGLKPQCKICHTAGSKKGDAARARKYRKGKGKETGKQYRKANKHKVYARVHKRRAAKIQATPLWFEKQEVENVYKRSCQLSETTGIHHVVDHIVPLLNERVCGLHCVSNLQIMTFEENHLKNNRFEI